MCGTGVQEQRRVLTRPRPWFTPISRSLRFRSPQSQPRLRLPLLIFVLSPTNFHSSASTVAVLAPTFVTNSRAPSQSPVSERAYVESTTVGPPLCRTYVGLTVFQERLPSHLHVHLPFSFAFAATAHTRTRTSGRSAMMETMHRAPTFATPTVNVWASSPLRTLA
jgi:hypothetical protein